MVELKDKADELIEHAGDYVETYYKLGLLKLTEKSTTAGSAIIASLLVAVLVIFFLLFLGMGLSWWIGNLLNSIVAGYFIVAGLYLVITICVVMMRKKIIDPFLRNFLVRKIYE
ncbi:MAG TPA: phage holin family protein [Flavitalea sp.]|nr:phage holin family protein [Flavitalea sp.]